MGELKMERQFKASPERVFAFVTEPANLAQWWGPEGMTVAGDELNLGRPGRWAVTFTAPDGGDYSMSGEVRAVDPPRSVEFTMISPGPGGPAESLVRFELRPAGNGGTSFVLIQSGMSEEMIAMGKRGWAGPLDRLERLAGGR